MAWITVFNSTPTLCPLQPTHPTELSRTLEKEMAWKAWRRLHGEYDPTSSMRPVAILQQVQNPPRCQRVGDFGSALEDWLSNKRQYEMFTDRNGRPYQASDDSLVAAMFRLMPKSLEETVMFTNEEEGFQELFDRLIAYSSTKQSVKMSEIKRQNRRDDRMDVDALSKGRRKGKKGSSGSGNGKGQNNTSNVVCWNCGKSGHYEKDCRQKWTQDKGWWGDKGNSRSKESNGKSKGTKGKGKSKSKGQGKLNSVVFLQAGLSETGAQGDEHAGGWTWSGEQAEGWWKAADDQNGSSSGQWMSANDQTAWESEGPVGGIEMNSIETKYIKQDQLVQEWLRLNYDSGAAVTALPIAVAGYLPLEKRGEFRGEFRTASGAVIPNLGKIKMKSTDENGIERMLRGNITEVSKPLLSAAEVSKGWDSLLFEDGGILLERNTSVSVKIRAVLAKHTVWSRRDKSIRLYRECNLYNAYVRTGDVTPQLAPVEPAEDS